MNVANRNEAAVVFARACNGYDPIIYDPAYIPLDDKLCTDDDEGEQSEAFMLNDKSVEYYVNDTDFVERNRLQAMFEFGGQMGTVPRIAIMFVLTLAILSMVLISLTVSQTLSSLLAS